MSEEQLKAFLDAVMADSMLQEKLKAARNAEALAEIANEAGYNISIGEIDQKDLPIVSTELDAMSGGGLPPSACMWPVSYAAPSTVSGTWAC